MLLWELNKIIYTMHCVKHKALNISESNELWFQKRNYEAFVVEGRNTEKSSALNGKKYLLVEPRHNIDYPKEKVVKILFTMNLSLWLIFSYKRYLLRNTTNRDQIRKKLFSLTINRVGANVNSLKCRCMEKCGKSSYCWLRGTSKEVPGLWGFFQQI